MAAEAGINKESGFGLEVGFCAGGSDLAGSQSAQLRG